MRNVLDNRCRGNQTTHFMFQNFSSESCPLWHNVEKYSTARQITDDKIIRHMQIACWMTKTTDIHSKYVCFSTSKMVTLPCLSVVYHALENTDNIYLLFTSFQLIGRPSQEEEEDRLYSDHLSNIWYLVTFFISQIPPRAAYIKGLEDVNLLSRYEWRSSYKGK